MAKYNTKREPEVQRTTTHEGGSGFTQKAEAELISILATGMGNTYYEKETEREVRFREVLNKVAKKNKLFAAKALVYARTVFGQRSVTHFGAVEMLPHLQGDSLGKLFFSKRNKKTKRGGIVYRLDDMTEILAAYLAKNKVGNDDKWTMPNSIKKGFRDAIEHADAYELAKYQMKSRGVSLVDIVNLVHPVETEKNGFIDVMTEFYVHTVKGTKFEKEKIDKRNITQRVPALRALVLGILKQFNTVEDKNTETGKVVAEKVKSGKITKEQAAVELNEAKTENYAELIQTKKIGYLALLRNIRNILKTNDTALLDEACELLVEPTFIKKSLVFPHQIDLAMEVMLLEFKGAQLQKVTKALGEAYEASIPNLAELFPSGKTAIVFDTSGSMTGGWGRSGGCKISYGKKQVSINSTPIEKAALVAATFAKGVAGDVYHFGTSCRTITGWNPNDSVNTLKKHFMAQSGNCGHGTFYQNIFPELAKVGGQYDRVFIMTDEQAADSVEHAYKSYCNQFGTPHVYYINLVGYGPTVMKQNTKVHRIFGYGADIYETAKKVEIDPEAVIKEINAIVI